jgi:uncharacterized protein YndB with AHSA1/START domain
MSEATAQASVVVQSTPESVWAALTDPDKIRDYFMGATVSTDWMVGSPITWSGEWQDRRYVDKGRILVYRPRTQLTFSHWSAMGGTEDHDVTYRVVDISLRPTETGTQVTLTQSNLSGEVTDADREHRNEYDANWAAVLEGLKKSAE